MAKYIFVAGGVVSSLGKGIATLSVIVDSLTLRRASHSATTASD
jgi:CTP synthase (UTP-ammonia lyase)